MLRTNAWAGEVRRGACTLLRCTCTHRARRTKPRTPRAYTAQAARAAEEPAGGAAGAIKIATTAADADPAEFFANRSAAVARTKAGGGNPYPHKFAVEYSLPAFVAHFADKVAEGERLDGEVSVAGRVSTQRASSAKLIFYDLVGDGQKVQVMADLQASELAENGEAFAALHSSIKRGDVVGVRGRPGKSKKGELSIFPSHIEVRAAGSPPAAAGRTVGAGAR